MQYNRYVSFETQPMVGFGEQVNASGFDPDMVGALPTTPANINNNVN